MAAASSAVPGFDLVELPKIIHAIIHEEPTVLDPEADKMLPVLKKSDAMEIWHKHGNFYSHLHDVWLQLCTWKQPQEICRLGLFHSAYSNAFVSMGIYDGTTPEGRAELRAVIGEKAEDLVWKFCVIPRGEMQAMFEKETTIPAEGITYKHIRTGEPVHCSASDVAAFLCETIADLQDQSFSWQSLLEEGTTEALWPGLMKPMRHRMSLCSRLARAARGQLEVTPPVFDGCTKILELVDETAASDLYFEAVTSLDVVNKREELVDKLLKASQHNPFVAEPHIVRAQILMQTQDWSKATHALKAGLELLFMWATNWDKRMSYVAWVAWSRTMLLQCSYKEWPNSHLGMESLGAVHPRQRKRGLSSAQGVTNDPAQKASKL